MRYTLTTTTRFLWLTLFISGAAHSAVSSVVSSPSSAQADIGRTTSVTVAWIVSNNKPGTISSTKGVFRTETGDVLGSVTEALAKTVTNSDGATITETVMVPPSVAVRAHLKGLTQLRYERSFGDGVAEATGSVSLYIITNAGANRASVSAIAGSDRTFDVSYFTLSFADNGIVANVDAGDAPMARAKARFTGNRIVDATWEIAGPNPGKEPKYETLGSVRQLVQPDTETVFNSPVLPTDKAGVYLLRLAITTPAVAFDEPVIRYFVSDHTKSVKIGSRLQTSSLAVP